jgi:hypothetical protein
MVSGVLLEKLFCKASQQNKTIVKNQRQLQQADVEGTKRDFGGSAFVKRHKQNSVKYPAREEPQIIMGKSSKIVSRFLDYNR